MLRAVRHVDVTVMGTVMGTRAGNFYLETMHQCHVPSNSSGSEQCRTFLMGLSGKSLHSL